MYVRRVQSPNVAKCLGQFLNHIIQWIKCEEYIGEGILLWAISFFFNEKKKNIFRFMHIALFLKVTY